MKIHWGVRVFVLIVAMFVGAIQALITYSQIGDAEYREFLDYCEGKSPRRLVAVQLDGWFLLDDAVDVAFFDQVFRHSKDSFELMHDFKSNYMSFGCSSYAVLLFDDGAIFDNLNVSFSDSHPVVSFSRQSSFHGEHDRFGFAVEPENMPFRVAKYFEVQGCGPW